MQFTLDVDFTRAQHARRMISHISQICPDIKIISSDDRTASSLFSFATMDSVKTTNLTYYISATAVDDIPVRVLLHLNEFIFRAHTLKVSTERFLRLRGQRYVRRLDLDWPDRAGGHGRVVVGCG